jgi:hypothetical protein
MSKNISNIEESDSLNNYKEKINIKKIIKEENIIKSGQLNLKKKNKKINFFCIFLKNLIYLFLFFISYYLFYLSLEKCHEGIDMCCTKYFWIKKKIIEEVISCLIISLLIELMFYNIITKLNIFHILIVFCYLYKYSHGLDFDDHGYFNFSGLFILVFIILVCFLPFNIFLYLNKTYKKNIIFFIFALFTVLYSLYIISKNAFLNCDDWPKGLNSSYIYNDKSKYGCQIIFPYICPYKIGKYFQDITKIKKVKCENIKKNSRETFLKISKSLYLNKTFIRIGFPLTNKDPICFLDSSSYIYIKKYFSQNLVDMEKRQLLDTVFKDKIPEIQVDFSNNSGGDMIINLHFNNTLSQERKNKEINSDPYSKNIMMIYIDSVSRANSMRQLKKTLKFISNFISYKGAFNKNFPSENYHSFQFFKYHSFRHFTGGNYPLIYYGRTKYENNFFLITKYLKENGYITSYVSDFCSKDNIRTFHNLSEEEVYDHQFLMCDPNAGHFNLNTIRCLYGKSISDHLFEYSEQFWRKYKNNRKFLNIVSNDGHEGTLEVLKYIDDKIYNFLNNLYNTNLLKDSSIFLLSDHGVGMPSIYFFSDFYRIEINLPMLYIIICDRKKYSYEDQYKNIYENQQSFITAYDIYNTIGNIIYGEKYNYIKNKTLEKDTPKSKEGKSLFSEINKIIRHPRIYSNMSYNSCK